MTDRAETLPPLLARIREFDTCTVANTIERFNLRLRNEGFADSRIRCLSPHLPPLIGYAATGRIRSAQPPLTGGLYYDHLEFWNWLAATTAPRVLVMQDIDRTPGSGAFVGEVHAVICQALHCVGYITNGAVRDLPAVEAHGFPLFAGSVAVSHAYAHVVDFGGTVEVGGLAVRPGDLLYGDLHGVVSIPLEIAAEIPNAARALQRHEREIMDTCRAEDFHLEQLGAILHSPPK
jgi:4-hydroxy-4-methyl-2-oxoglutarate aldolase